MSDVLTSATRDADRLPFGRLVRVEWRKMHDTRGGFWLLLVTGILLAVVTTITLLVGLLNDEAAAEFSFGGIFNNVMLFPVSLLVPVLAITAVTSEWSQRTALTTFTLEPHRGRVMAAKGTVAVLVAVVTILVALVMAAITTWIVEMGQGVDAKWSIDADQFLVTLLVQVLGFITAFALGMCFLSTPGAIVVYYAATMILPLIAYSILFILFGWFRDLIPWFDFGYASIPWTGGTWPNGDDAPIDGLAVARMASASLIWLVLPVGLGLRRILRAEVK